jgi:glycosyltransferase involved in cell wall biosynthesis
LNPAESLSATLIVRDEEQVLEACLSSLKAVVDEIIVVDTGSLDRTAELAADNGAKVFRFAWCDDFSAARNFAIEQASCTWFLYIDADERVRCDDRGALRSALGERGGIAASVRFHPRTGFTAYREYRLYRRDPRLRFQGRVHETMLPEVHRLVAAEGATVLDCDLTIDHVGYDGPQTHKAERYLPLLRQATEADPERVYLWWHLGCIHRELGQVDEAEAYWRHGLALVRAKGRRDSSDCLCHVELIKLDLARGGDAAELIDEGRRLRPDHHLLQWLEAHSLMRRERFKDATALFAGLAVIDPDRLIAENSYDKRIFGAGAAERAADCAFRAGDYAEAARWYGILERDTAGAVEFRTKRLLAEARSRRAGPPPAPWREPVAATAGTDLFTGG